jgi:hypothetical protein
VRPFDSGFRVVPSRGIEGVERVAGLGDLEWRIEEAGMRDDAQELSEAEDRDGPARRPLGQLDQSRACAPLLRQLLAVSVDENVRVDRDHPRPSIRS